MQGGIEVPSSGPLLAILQTLIDRFKESDDMGFNFYVAAK